MLLDVGASLFAWLHIQAMARADAHEDVHRRELKTPSVHAWLFVFLMLSLDLSGPER